MKSVPIPPPTDEVVMQLIEVIIDTMSKNNNHKKLNSSVNEKVIELI